MKPGEYLLAESGITGNIGRETVVLTVANTGDRPIQVGSHFHFFEVNRALEFERSLAFGKRLNIPSGLAVRFEPGEEKEVTLVQVGGRQVIYGLNNLADGSVGALSDRRRGIRRAAMGGFKGVADDDPADE